MRFWLVECMRRAARSFLKPLVSKGVFWYFLSLLTKSARRRQYQVLSFAGSTKASARRTLSPRPSRAVGDARPYKPPIEPVGGGYHPPTSTPPALTRPRPTSLFILNFPLPPSQVYIILLRSTIHPAGSDGLPTVSKACPVSDG